MEIETSLTVEQENKVAEEIDKAIKKLEDLVPNFIDYIDIEAVNMKFAEACVCGQVYRGKFGQAMIYGPNLAKEEYEEERTTAEKLAHMGFEEDIFISIHDTLGAERRDSFDIEDLSKMWRMKLSKYKEAA